MRGAQPALLSPLSAPRPRAFSSASPPPPPPLPLQAPTGILLLCDVALGAPYERLAAQYDAAASCALACKQSCWGKGKTAPHPSGTVLLPTDAAVRVPMGKGATATILYYLLLSSADGQGCAP